MTDTSLAGRVALITGAAGGIGAAVARRFANAGASLALLDLDGPAAIRLATELTRGGNPAFGLACDVASPVSIRAAVEGVEKRFGHVDVLVNSAGIMGRTAPLTEQTDADWQRVMDLDLTSVFRVTRAVLPGMRARARGSIVSLASIAGKEGTPNLVPYSVAKAGIIAFTKALGKELAREGIRVNCVAPGVIQTAFLDQLSAETVASMLSKVPMGRAGTAEEIAEIVLFLASDAASFLTAQCFDASGGRATY